MRLHVADATQEELIIEQSLETHSKITRYTHPETENKLFLSPYNTSKFY